MNYKSVLLWGVCLGLALILLDLNFFQIYYNN